jgi:L-threonylcarbamoyladenylate synthase
MCNNNIEEAVACIREGGIVAFPTETYYGLAAEPDCEQAIERLFEIKKREFAKPLLLLVESRASLPQVVAEVPEPYISLMAIYWPGPLTLLFPAKPCVSKRITGGTDTVGVRISSHPVAQKLVAGVGKAITATSANISGMPPAVSALDVKEIFQGSVDFILDGGHTDAGLCSTILGFKNEKLTVYRKGQVDVIGDFVG